MGGATVGVMLPQPVLRRGSSCSSPSCSDGTAPLQVSYRPVPPPPLLPLVSRRNPDAPDLCNVPEPLGSPQAAAPASRLTAAKASGRPLPDRLRRIDDQTVVPRELHKQMMRLGDAHRGSFGTGQHRLAFSAQTGGAVLRQSSH